MGSPLARLAWFPRHLGEISGGLGIGATALLTFAGSRVWGVVLAVLAVLALAASIGLSVRRSKMRRRAADSRSTTIVEAADIRALLKSSAGVIGMPVPWRISVYEVNADKWHRLARRSSYPDYENHAGRLSFDSGSGCLGRALRSGGTDALPALPDPKQDFDGWIAAQVNRRISHRDAERMRMRSQSYAAIVHEIPFGPYEGAIVGIVAECEEPLGVELARMVRAFSLETTSMLHKLVKVQLEAERLRTLVYRDE